MKLNNYYNSFYCYLYFLFLFPIIMSDSTTPFSSQSKSLLAFSIQQHQEPAFKHISDQLAKHILVIPPVDTHRLFLDSDCTILAPDTTSKLRVFYKACLATSAPTIPDDSGLSVKVATEIIAANVTFHVEFSGTTSKISRQGFALHSYLSTHRNGQPIKIVVNVDNLYDTLDKTFRSSDLSALFHNNRLLTHENAKVRAKRVSHTPPTPDASTPNSPASGLDPNVIALIQAITESNQSLKKQVQSLIQNRPSNTNAPDLATYINRGTPLNMTLIPDEVIQRWNRIKKSQRLLPCKP